MLRIGFVGSPGHCVATKSRLPGPECFQGRNTSPSMFLEVTRTLHPPDFVCLAPRPGAFSLQIAIQLAPSVPLAAWQESTENLRLKPPLTTCL